MPKTYTVIGRSTVSQEDFSEIIYNCGHKHRTIISALRCLRSRSNDAAIEVYANDQQFEGRRLNCEEIYDTEYAYMHRKHTK